MTRGAAGRALALAGVAALVIGCAAAPLPSMRPLSHQSAGDLAWDARTCAWAAEDVSGYWADLSPPENAIVAVFVSGIVREAPAAAPVTTPQAVRASSPSPSHLGRGGRQKFEEADEQCMRAHGYERSSPALEERSR